MSRMFLRRPKMKRGGCFVCRPGNRTRSCVVMSRAAYQLPCLLKVESSAAWIIDAPWAHLVWSRYLLVLYDLTTPAPRRDGGFLHARRQA